MFKSGKEWENFYLQELPLIIQEDKTKAVIIGIEQLKSLLSRIQELENKISYHEEKFLENLYYYPGLKGKKKKQRFISWKEENFQNLGP